MARQDPQVNLRLPAELKEQLQNSAEKNNRSLTAEIVSRLVSTFDNEGGSREDFKKVIEMMLVALDPDSTGKERFFATKAAFYYLSDDPGNDIRNINVEENLKLFEEKFGQQEQVEKIKSRVDQRSVEVIPKAVKFLEKRGWKLISPESSD